MWDPEQITEGQRKDKLIVVKYNSWLEIINLHEFGEQHQNQTSMDKLYKNNNTHSLSRLMHPE